MHPDVSWMIYQVDATAREQQFREEQVRQLAAYPRLQCHIAFWSGQHLLRLAHWLLRYGQPYEQWTLSVRR